MVTNADVEWQEGEIEGVKFQSVTKHADQRGWLAEVFRSDEIKEDIMPVMGYVSITHAGMTRGPHEHRNQTDLFGFVGPGDFRLKLWDNRSGAPTYGHMMTVVVGESDPMLVTVPPGIIHGYTNISEDDAQVINVPNRLFAGEGRKQPVDEVRYEDVENAPFKMEDQK